MAIYAETAIRPTVQEIANLMPDRTTLPRSAGGGDAGTFNANTTPTDTVVDALIDEVVDTIEGKVPVNASNRVKRAARSVVKYEVAILVEGTYFSHQGEVNTARVDLWTRLLERNDQILTGGMSGTHDVGIA